VIGATTQGPAQQLVHSMTEYVAVFGDRTGAAGQATYDAADVFFREGGGLLYVGNTAFAGGLSAASSKSSKSTAKVPPEDEAITDAIAQASENLAATLAAADPGVAAALSALTKDLGPGQVFIADQTLATDPANQAALTAHAEANNRVALLSTPDGAATALIAAGTALHTDQNARYAACFAPSAVVPGVTPGTTRTVPMPAVIAGIIARNDLTLTPNQAAAGVNGASAYMLDLAATYTDAEYSSINDAGVNMTRRIYGQIENYGYRSCVDPATSDSDWLEFGNARLNMAICAEADAIGERYVFSQIDGRGITIGDFGSDLSSMLLPYWTGGALYGATADEAYQVNVGSTVNTPDTIANGELHAILMVRMSHMAEWVVIEVVKVATTQSLVPGNPATPALAA
jgi:hypothetical protein